MFSRLWCIRKNSVLFCGQLNRCGCRLMCESGHQRIINEKLENTLKAKDGIPADFRLIYRAPYSPFVQLAYGMALTAGTTMGVLTAMLFPMELEYPVAVAGFLQVESFQEFLFALAAMCISVGQVCLVAHKYPYRIYSDAQARNYIWVFQHLLPWKVNQSDMIAGELSILKFKLPGGRNLFSVKSRKVFLVEHYFYRPVDLHKMMELPEKKVKTKIPGL